MKEVMTTIPELMALAANGFWRYRLNTYPLAELPDEGLIAASRLVAEHLKHVRSDSDRKSYELASNTLNAETEKRKLQFELIPVCFVCGATPHFRAGDKHFCKDHKHFAVRQLVNENKKEDVVRARQDEIFFAHTGKRKKRAV